MELQHGALAAFDLVGVVGVDQEGERGAVGAGGRLDHVRQVALAGLLVEVLELLAGVLLVLGQVEVAAVGDALELGPADREQVLDVAGPGRVVGELVGLVGADHQEVRPDAEVEVPVAADLDPLPVPLVGLGRRHEELHLHLLELAGAEDEVARGDLVAEGLADLGDAERRRLAGEVEHVLEVDEDALGGLRPQVGDRARVLHRADVGLEHQVELAGLGQLAVGAVAGVLRRLLRAGRVLEVVGAEALAAGPAVDHRVAEAAEVAGGLPDLRVLEDRRVEGDDVVALGQHRAPPLVLDVVLEQHAVVAVVVGGAESAVDLGGGENEAPALGQGDDFVHRDFGVLLCCRFALPWGGTV